MRTIPDLETVVDRFQTDKGKAKFISSLAGRVALPPQLLDFALDYYSHPDRRRAGSIPAKIALAAGMPARAVEAYLQAGNVVDAAKTAMGNGLPERGRELCETLIKKHESAGNFLSAAEFASLAAMPDRARSLYERFIAQPIENIHHFLGQAEFSVRQAGFLDLVEKVVMLKINYLEKQRNYLQAADTALKAGMPVTALRNYCRAGKYEKAGDVAKNAGMEKRAHALYKRAVRISTPANSFDAGVLAEKLGLYERAVELFAMAGYTSRAAAIAEKIELTDRAIGLFEQAELFECAARAAENTGQTGRAVELYTRALTYYESNGLYQDGLDLASRLGRTESATFFQRLITLNQKITSSSSVSPAVQ